MKADRAAVGAPEPLVIVIMGVAGSGKTTIGRTLATAMDCAFADGDDLHPVANVAKMAGGAPLTDADRTPWLARVAELVDAWRAEGRCGVVTCSALKRSYRRIVIGDRPNVRLVYLTGSFDRVRERMAGREGHFMPVSLLESQFADLEPPNEDEAAIVEEIAPPPEQIVRGIMTQLTRPGQAY